MDTVEDAGPDDGGPDDLEALFARLKGQCLEDVERADDWYSDAREDFGFVASDQWSDEDKAVLREQLRPVITMNQIEAIIDSVSGSEVGNRQEVRYIPRQQGAVKVNELLTSAAKWFRDQCDAEDEESDAFRDTIICGMGWVETRLDYEDDPDGAPIVDRTDPMEMVWDSTAKKKNLADMRRVFHVRRDIPIDEARALVPNDDFEDADYHAEWIENRTDKNDPNHKNGQFYEGDKHVSDGDTGDYDKRVTLVRAQWYEREPAFRVMDPANPTKLLTLSPDEHNDLQQRLKMAGVPAARSVKVTRKVYKQAYLGRTLLEVGEAPCKDHFSFHCITGKRHRNKNQFYGLVRNMKDPQRWANKWLSQTLHIMNSSAKGGIIAERGVFDNDNDAEESWAKQDAITWAKPGKLSADKWALKPTAQFPQGFFQLTQMALKSIPDSAGINLETLGMREAQQAASLDMQRKQSAMTILQPMFDGLRRYRKMQGRLLLYLIRNYLSDGRLIRIVGEGEDQYVPLVRQEGVETYDVIVDESPTSTSQKEATWAMLQQILPVIGKMLPPATWLALLKYSPLPTSAQTDISESFQKTQQEAKPDPEAEKLAADIKAGEARTNADIEQGRRKTEAEIDAMNLKANAAAEIQMRQAQTRALAKGMTIDATGQALASPDMMSSLLVELTRALQAMSAPKRVVRDPKTGDVIGVEAAMVQ